MSNAAPRRLLFRRALPRTRRQEFSGSWRSFLESHRQERLAWQFHHKLALEYSVYRRNRHLPWIDNVGAVLHSRREFEAVLRRLVYVEIEEVVASFLPRARVVREQVIPPFRGRTFQNFAQESE